MATKQFKAESKRLLDLMVNSIYTHKEIFLRELISNASDAIDKIYYKTLSDENLTFNREDYFVKIDIDSENRKLTVNDTGIGMNQSDLDENLGVIAKSGSFAFKKENEIKDGHDIIGQFGVGFYSAFMIADRVIVRSKALGEEKAYQWESDGVEGYTIEECTKEDVGTEIILQLKDNTEDENYDEYLEEFKLKEIIKKYSDFVRYPIKMDLTSSKLKEGTEDEYEDIVEEKTVNSMVPIWKKRKSELKKEDYENFYSEKHYGFDKPLKHIHTSADGAISYNAILFIPETTPFDFYTKEYKRGLELYSNGVMIMNKCEELLPDYFSFVKGVVDSEDLSLNISREVLQHDRQLKLIAKNLKTKIKNELVKMQKNKREDYEKFFGSFGKVLKYGVYSDYGMHKDDIQELLMFHSSTEDKLVSIDEYIERMKEDQKYIYYATGDNIDRIKKSPQTELVSDKGYEILYFTDEVDEFAIKMITNYKEKEFKSVSSSDLGIDQAETESAKKANEENKGLFEQMKNILSGKIKEVKASERLKKHPVCLSNAGDLSIEMEKILSQMPEGGAAKAEKILEINTNHEVFETLQSCNETDEKKLELYTKILYNQALLIEGLEIEDPVEFTNNICEIMK